MLKGCKRCWKPASSNRDCVATSESYQAPLKKNVKLYGRFATATIAIIHAYQLRSSHNKMKRKNEKNWVTVITVVVPKPWQKNTRLEKTVSLLTKQGPEA